MHGQFVESQKMWIDHKIQEIEWTMYMKVRSNDKFQFNSISSGISNLLYESY